MTLFEIAVPLIALAVAASGAALLRMEARRIDIRQDRRRHPHE